MQLKIDHTEQDPAESTRSFEQPTPGMYQATIADATVRFHDKEKKKPRDVELVYKVTSGKYKNAQLWEYASFSKSAMWKLDQVLLAAGLLTSKKRRTSFKSEKELERKLKGCNVTVRVRGGKNLDDEYRAEVAQVLVPMDPDDEDAEDPFEDVDEEETEEEVDDVEDDEEEEDEDEVELYDEDELEEMSLADIKKVAKDLGVKVAKGKRKTAYIDEIIDAQADAAGEEEEDDEEWTLEELMTMSIKELREVADEFELDHSGMRKTALRDMIIEELGFDDDEDEDDDVPF